jgi:hypothetical protein
LRQKRRNEQKQADNYFSHDPYSGGCSPLRFRVAAARVTPHVTQR